MNTSIVSDVAIRPSCPYILVSESININIDILYPDKNRSKQDEPLAGRRPSPSGRVSVSQSRIPRTSTRWYNPERRMFPKHRPSLILHTPCIYVPPRPRVLLSAHRKSYVCTRLGSVGAHCSRLDPKLPVSIRDTPRWEAELTDGFQSSWKFA